MIHPVSGPSEAREQLSVTFSPAKSVPRYRDTICNGKNDSVKFFDPIKDFIQMIWSWVKYNVFFCFFDVEEERQDHLTQEIKDYIDAYFDEAAVPSVKGRNKLIKAYKELDSQIKETVAESIVEILKEAKPNISELKVKSCLKTVLENDPFCKITDKTKPAEEQEIQVLGDALLRANQKLAGFSKV